MAKITVKPSVHPPRFNSEELQQAFDDVSPYISDFLINLDSISQDIKALENFLETSGIRFATDQRVSNDKYEFVSWGEHEESDRFRLLYKRMEADEFGDETGLAELRPLIETPALIRISSHSALPRLLRSIGEAVRVSTLKKPVPAQLDDMGMDDIPF